MGLIKEVSNNPRQSQGALVFDNLLLQSNPGAAGKLQQAGSSLNDIDQRLGSANETAAQKAASVRSGNEAVRNQARGALTEGYTGLGQSLSEREAAADAEQAGQVKMLKQAIASGQLSPEQLAQLKMSAGDKTYGVDLSNFVNYQDGIDKYSVANEDDLARQAALRELAGDMDLGESILSSSSPLGQKGAGFAADLKGFEAAKQKQIQAYNSALNDPSLSADLPQPDGNGGYVARNEGNQTSIQNLYDQYKDSTSERGRAYFKDIIEPAFNKLQQKFNFNQTLGQGAAQTSRFRPV
jgi:hypothetical protein